MPEAADTLVVGSRGLLGSAVVRALRWDGRSLRTASVPWHDRGAAVEAVVESVGLLLGTGRPWRLLWCAGSGVIGTTQADLDAELATLGEVLARLTPMVRAASGPGAVFLASSAGGVYAGSAQPPFTELTEPQAISPYGELKLAAEQLFERFARATATPLLIGRIANLYGPGQDGAKAQGLVTALCRSHLGRRPASIYVSLDTSRDYIYVDDAARLVVAGADRAAASAPGTVTIKILASQRGTTIAAILGELRRITKQRPRVVLGSSPLAKFQIRDLRFRSLVWTELDSLVTTDLPAGIAATMASAAAEARRPRLAGSAR